MIPEGKILRKNATAFFTFYPKVIAITFAINAKETPFGFNNKEYSQKVCVQRASEKTQ